MKKRLVALLLVISVVFSLAACGKPKATPTANPSTPTPTQKAGEPTNGATPTEAPVITNVPKTLDVAELKFTPGTILRMACGYNNAKTGITFDADTAKSGITLANGKTYNTGDLKPTWVRMEELFGMKFEDKYQGNSAGNEFKYWQEKLGEVDMVAGSAAVLSEYGEEGYLVNIAEFLQYMPNFKAYLESNTIVRLSITGNTSTGAIYFSPYFDGVDDIERMPLMRTDWVVKLLDGDGEFTAASSKDLAAAKYQPYMPTTGTVEVEVVSLDGKKVEKVTKDYGKAGNIVKAMNDKLASGKLTGVEAVNMLRTYIDTAYNGYYGKNRSNLFIGQNAAWDADELVALLRCVVANSQTLNGKDTIEGLFARENDNLQRQIDMFRFAGTLFGVRGLESRADFLYFDNNGVLHDARAEKDTYAAIERLQDMAAEGIIATSFMNGEAVKTENMLKEDLGFMHYDYNQTQTIYNENGALDSANGEKYMAVMVPVARWYDGTDANGVYMRFTESWRSVKTDGWAISKSGVDYKGDGKMTDKLKAALSIIDYAYSPEGQILMSYGPDEFIKKNADGSYVTFSFNGKDMPVIADATYEELWSKAKGNYTNYARMYLGSTLSFLKSQAFEYQCTTRVGREGAGHISTAIGLGTIKHPLLAVADNMWYTSIPTVLPNTTEEATTIKGLSGLSDNFSGSKGKYNLLVDLIQKGYSGNQLKLGSADAVINAVKTDEKMNIETFLYYKQEAWTRLVNYYNTLKK
jgi:putative aldouronate transport system substrate-binding protein